MNVTRLKRLLIAPLLCVLLAGCDPSPQRIDTWTPENADFLPNTSQSENVRHLVWRLKRVEDSLGRIEALLKEKK